MQQRRRVCDAAAAMVARAATAGQCRAASSAGILGNIGARASRPPTPTTLPPPPPPPQQQQQQQSPLTPRLARAAVRSLLRACRPFDERPSTRAALSLYRSDAALTRRVPLLDAGEPPTSSAEEVAEGKAIAATVAREVKALVTPASGSEPAATGVPAPRALYRPDKTAYTSMVRAVSATVRDMAAQVADGRVDGAMSLDVAYNAVKLLQHVAAGVATPLPPSATVATVPPAAVAGLSDAAALSPGCLMVEHPSVLAPGRAVAYVYDVSRNLAELHGNEAWMLRAYVVNRPFRATVADVLRRTDLGPFGGLQLFHGGMDAKDLAVIHRVASIEGAAPVDEEGSAFIGGSMAAINAALAEGRASPADFKVVLGAMAIPLDGGEGSLALREDERWWILSGGGARDIALLQPLPQSPPSAPVPEGSYNFDHFAHQDAVWAAAVARLAASTTEPSLAATYADWAALHPATLAALAASLPLPVARPFSRLATLAAARAGASPAGGGGVPGLRERIQ